MRIVNGIPIYRNVIQTLKSVGVMLRKTFAHKHWIMVLGLYVVLALISLHQPLFKIATHMTGAQATDYYFFHWNYWWIRHALTHGLSIYETNYVFFPFVSSTVYHAMAAFWYPVWAFIEPLAGTFTAFGVIFTAAMTLCGVSFYALLRREGVSRGLALVGGAMLELAPLMFSAIYWSMTSLIAWFWLPLALITWGELARSRTWLRTVLWASLLGVTLWAMMITDMQYPIYLAFLIVPYGVWTLVRYSSPVRQIGAGIIALGIAVFLLYLGGTLPAILAADQTGFSPTPPERAVAIDFPLGFVWHTTGGNVSLGAVVLPLVLTALMVWIRMRRRRGANMTAPAWLWGAVLIAPLVLSAGASITLGSTEILMPYRAFHALFGGLFRYPERLSAVIVIAGGLFALKVLSKALADQRGLRQIVALILFFIVIADSRMFASVPIQPQPTRYALYEQMGREPYEYTVIEVPTGASSGEGIVGIPEYSALEFYGIIHGKRMINGHLSRVDVGHYWWIRTDDAMMAWLGQRRFLESAAVAHQLRERVFGYPIGYVVIHTQLIDPYAPTLTEITSFLNTQTDALCPPIVEADLIAYRTQWHPDGCGMRTPPESVSGVYVIDVGSLDDMRYWMRVSDDQPSMIYPPELVFDLRVRWMGDQARLAVDLPPGVYTMTLRAQAFEQPRVLSLRHLGEKSLLGTITIAPGALTDYMIEMVGGSLTLDLISDGTQSPADVGLGDDTRELSIMLDSITFTRR